MNGFYGHCDKYRYNKTDLFLGGEKRGKFMSSAVELV